MRYGNREPSIVNVMKSIDPDGSALDMELESELYRGPKNLSSTSPLPVLTPDQPGDEGGKNEEPGVVNDSNAASSIERTKDSNEGLAHEKSLMEVPIVTPKVGDSLRKVEEVQEDGPKRRKCLLPPPQGRDVVFGGVTKQRWPGNSLFNKLVQQRRDAADKEESALSIMRIVRSRGGKFYYCHSEDGTIQYRPCTELQTIKYTMRHLESAIRSKLFSACTASYLQLLYTTHESSFAPQVTPPPLVVKQQMVGVLLSDVDPLSRAAAMTAAPERSHQQSEQQSCTEAVGRVNVGATSSSNPSSALPRQYPYFHPQYPPPHYSYYPYQNYPHYHGSYGGVQDTTKPSSPSSASASASTDSVPPLSADNQKSAPKETVPPNAPTPAAKRTPKSRKVQSPPTTTTAYVFPETVSSGKSTTWKSPAKTDDAKHGDPGVYLPRGVTVRPSGKWQTQIYFFGKSRYIGVYPTAVVASVAYTTVTQLLRAHKSVLQKLHRIDEGMSEKEANRLLMSARELALRATTAYVTQFGKGRDMNDFTEAVEMTKAACEYATDFFQKHGANAYWPPEVGTS